MFYQTMSSSITNPDLFGALFIETTKHQFFIGVKIYGRQELKRDSKTKVRRGESNIVYNQCFIRP